MATNANKADDPVEEDAIELKFPRGEKIFIFLFL